MLQMRVFYDRDFIKAGHDLAHILKAGPQISKCLGRGARAHEFVPVQNGQAVLVNDWHDGFGETVVIPRGLCPDLALDCQRVGLFTTETIFGGDQVGGNALGDEISAHCHGRINRNCGAIAAHGNTAHHFNAAGNVGIARTAFDLVCSQIYGLHSRGAKTVDGKAGDGLVKVRGQNGRAGQTAALFFDLGDVAPNHVLNGVALQVIAVFQRVQDLRGQADGGDFVQRAVFAAFAAGGAHGVVNISVGHGIPFVKRGQRGCRA